jgi:hypothetical protein
VDRNQGSKKAKLRRKKLRPRAIAVPFADHADGCFVLP